MGYPVRYRDSQGRQERRLSRPDGAPVPTRPANDNKPHPLKPANDNYPANLPPQFGRDVWHPAVRYAAKTAMMVHPGLRILRYAWDLYELYNWYKNTRISLGDFTLTCDSGFLGACLAQPDGCTDPPFDRYCIGPMFQSGLSNPLNCGITGQAGMPNASGAWPTDFGTTTGTKGVVVWAVRNSHAAPPCHPSSLRTQYRWNMTAPRTKPHPPHRVPYYHSTPPFWAPFRWYKPEIFMKPGVDYDVDPLPPPYWVIPKRDDVDRGYDIEPVPIDDPVAPPHWRVPPRPREKEKKVKWTGPARILNAILVSLARVHGKGADLRDILKALDEALPKNLQLKGPDKKKIPKLLENVYRNWDKLDAEKAILNVIKEIAEDVVGGFGDRLRSETAKNFGWLKNKVSLSARF